MTTYNISFHPLNESHTSYGGSSEHVYQLRDQEELDRMSLMCRDEKNMAGFWKATIMPIRTDLDSLPKDLFFPTLINGVIKTDNISSACLIFIAILWDAATLPIRLLTLIPRLLYNAFIVSPQDHPLRTFLRERGFEFTPSSFYIRTYQETHHQNRIRQEGESFSLYLSDREAPFFHCLRPNTGGQFTIYF